MWAAVEGVFEFGQPSARRSDASVQQIQPSMDTAIEFGHSHYEGNHDEAMLRFSVSQICFPEQLLCSVNLAWHDYYGLYQGTITGILSWVA